MRKPIYLILLALVLSGMAVHAQNIFYAAAKAGLNLRETPEAGSPVLAKIPYGEKVTHLNEQYYNQFVTEGMYAHWFYVSYGNTKGYVANVYLFPVPPPKEGVKDLLDYLKSIGTPVNTWHKKMGDEETTEDVEKITFDNGITYRLTGMYESSSETISLPFFSTFQAFVLARLLSPSLELLKPSDSYPQETVKSDGGRNVIIMNRYETMKGYHSIMYFVRCDGGCQSIEIVSEDGETFITFADWT